jgi:vitamin B12 transporter
MVVTANRLVEPVSDSLAAVRVITERDLAGSAALSLGEVLRQFAGVEVASTGGLGQITSVFMRGANPNHTLVLVDGQRLQSATAGTTAFENIPVGQIARIEVVPGPVSGLYGSDAIGGVIQIFTKGASSAPVTEVAVGLGSYQTGRLQASTRRRSGAFDYSLSLGYLGSESYNATSPDIPFGLFNPDRDPYRNRNASARLAWRYLEGHSLGLNYLQSVSATHFDNGPASDDVGYQSLSQFGLTSIDQFTPAWNSEARVGIARDSYRSDAFGTTESLQRQASWQNTVRLEGVGRMLVGADYLAEQVGGDTVFSRTARATRAGFVGYAGDLGPAGLRANLRRADNAQFGSVTTGSLAAGYRLAPELKLRASYGTGFHAPTFNDLYASYPPYFYSNPLLRPERSRNRELGADLDLAGHHLGISLFDNRIRDLIQIADDPEHPFASTVRNVDSARIRGVELSYVGARDRTRWEARATFQDPVDDATRLRLSRRATRFGSARLSQPWLGCDWSAELLAFGPRFDSANEAPATRLGGYGLINLVLARAIDTDWRAELRWNNLTAHHYVLVQGYNVPGSSVFGSLTWTSH